jgi:hypothetical protein
MLLALAALVPSLFWDSGPKDAQKVKDAGITHVAVPANQLDSWRNVPGLTVEAGSLDGAVKLIAPTVNYRVNQASASRAPWLESNGWRFLRQPDGRFYYDVKDVQAGLAAAEAFAFGAHALVKTDDSGLAPLARMQEFLNALPASALPPIADFGFLDDGTASTGELMNVMIRHNLLFRRVTAPDSSLPLNVRPDHASAPALLVQEIREKLGDDKRSIRIYGSVVVIARLQAANGKARVHLLNYTAGRNTAQSIRVRVLGKYPHHSVTASGIDHPELLDFTAASDATEFTLPELKIYAVIDLRQ